jgi:L-alanine-DL-glutamate epimerase-like enolase superfamily enzyme
MRELLEQHEEESTELARSVPVRPDEELAKRDDFARRYSTQADLLPVLFTAAASDRA